MTKKKQGLEDQIIMEALRLSKAHTAWKRGLESVWSFSKAKTRFSKLLKALIRQAEKRERVKGFMDCLEKQMEQNMRVMSKPKEQDD